MEKLKSLVPNNLKQMVAHSTPDDLPLTSSSLLDFFLNLQQFHQIVRDLAGQESGLCAKNIDSALELKQKGNQYYLSGDYIHALSCYTKALRVAPMDANDKDRNLVATLYVNRASVSQVSPVSLTISVCRYAMYIGRIQSLVEVEVHYDTSFHRSQLPHLVVYVEGGQRQNYQSSPILDTGIKLNSQEIEFGSERLDLYDYYFDFPFWRGKVNVSLENHDDAVHDLTIAKNRESSLAGKKQIESELKIILDQSNRTSNKVVQHTKNNLRVSEESVQVQLQCVTTPDKGRGITSQYDIPEGSLVHSEEPYAVTISKHCRETHCHYCLNELPADAIPCTSCSIPLYCSHRCRGQAGGQVFKNCPMERNINDSVFDNLEEYISQITLDNDFYPEDEHIFEHKHECKGVHWPVILPSDVVLAGRVVVKSVQKNGVSTDVPNLLGKLELSHNYSQVVILISQIRVNSLAIVRMNSNNYGLSDHVSSGSTCTVEQVRVGLAIYTAGSLFNHSCLPNIHAYFLSRTLMIRTTEFVPSGYSLELSYGPQVGQWDCKDRLKFLEDEYSFRCQCSGCSELNTSDLVINAFCCVDPNCPGVVLDNSLLNCEKQKRKHLPAVPQCSSSAPHLQVGKLSSDYVGLVAYLLLEENNRTSRYGPGYCLKCGSDRDLESSYATVDEAWIYIRRLQDAIISKEISRAVLLDASRFLGLLRSILHAYNKSIAEAEDNLAQAYCLVGDLISARDHCKASIEILEKLYGHNHIVIGYELVKLSSIQLSLDDHNAVDTISRLAAIFLRYFGSHAETMFPHLLFLQREALKLRQ
ncbi:tetratricopeptide repeat (TPR)-like superfamily protein [Citrus sinensis]|uniref:Tetratricopeptide repeat (TPR)-like superfamily protein n=1 Tax=Citrus sinensis TaxID=2711 RepID=A0ACB8JMD6_CITSI|nr:tetratricopeptide repeat (TPR)-like superfamily protein [Citrus sinensis]